MSKVTKLKPNEPTIAESVLQVASAINDGTISAAAVVIVIETTAGVLTPFGFGAHGDTARLVGLLEMAKLQMALGSP